MIASARENMQFKKGDLLLLKERVWAKLQILGQKERFSAIKDKRCANVNLDA